MSATLFTINGGSSSVKIALFDGDSLARPVAGKVDRIGPQATIHLTDAVGQTIADGPVAGADHAQAIAAILDHLPKAAPLDQVAAVGHRVVHGGPNYARSQLIDAAMLADLKRISPWDPDHLPAEIQLIEALSARLPRGRLQIACFDTAFPSRLADGGEAAADSAAIEMRRRGVRRLRVSRHLVHVFAGGVEARSLGRRPRRER